MAWSPCWVYVRGKRVVAELGQDVHRLADDLAGLGDGVGLEYTIVAVSWFIS
jgi:hypothetical protein